MLTAAHTHCKQHLRPPPPPPPASDTLWEPGHLPAAQRDPCALCLSSPGRSIIRRPNTGAGGVSGWRVAGLPTCTLRTPFSDFMCLLRVGLNSNIKSDEEEDVSLPLIDFETGGLVGSWFLPPCLVALVGSIPQCSSPYSPPAPLTPCPRRLEQTPRPPPLRPSPASVPPAPWPSLPPPRYPGNAKTLLNVCSIEGDVPNYSYYTLSMHPSTPPPTRSSLHGDETPRNLMATSNKIAREDYT
ncbi:verprolin-like [Portunus trituberculatus]|uniref:verprolin-like n=1 Tax=Portunus trituberculatus TaxID=210409 RepID=UPI001E1CBB9A|nr:verprolin-like [Portunus trituberculatus]